MSATLHDVLNASVVFLGVDLVPNPLDVENLKTAIGTDLRITAEITVPQPTGDVERVRTLVLDRERVEITTHGSKSTVLRQHPGETDLPRLAEVTALALSLSALTAETIGPVGYNVELIFDQDSGQPAGRYLGERLFDYQHLGGETWPLWSGSGRVVFGDSQLRRMFTMEARFSDDQTPRVYVSANLHVADGCIPTEDEVRESLEMIWRDAHTFMERVDQKGAA